jgi:hypothetical protein
MAASLGGTPNTGLLGEINRAHPLRSITADGGIGDEQHRQRRSEHNPCGCCDVVCARDFTHDPKHGFDAHAFAEWLRNRVLHNLEPRVMYVISDRRIFSGPGERHAAGVWRPYSGKNPHTKHVHVSVKHGPECYDDPRSWEWTGHTG